MLIKFNLVDYKFDGFKAQKDCEECRRFAPLYLVISDTLH